jgi:dihydrolipoamide dehydrogenase
MTLQCDLLIIGAGPGGYVAAIRAAQLGMSVIVVDKSDKLGGTCLNVGCIPSKALLHASHKFWDSKHNFERFGIFADNIRLDLQKLMSYKNSVVDELTRGIGFLFKKNNIQFLQGSARFKSANEVEVTSTQQTQTINSKHTIIATGSAPSTIPNIQVDEERIVSSTGILSLTKVPKHLVVIGGGYIGLEMASVWSRLGSLVTVIEYADRILPSLDHELAQTLQRTLEKNGFVFRLQRSVQKIEKRQKNMVLHIQCGSQSSQLPEIMECDTVLVATGRTPITDGLNLNGIGIQTNEKGFIQTNVNFQTTIPNIYAIGDVIGGAMLAHKASDEGIAVAEILANQAGHVNYGVIPSVVYTHPEVASVGKTEEELKLNNVEYRVGKFPFMANSRAKIIGETAGFVKILAHTTTDQVLGAHIIGDHAGNLIAEIATVMEFSGASEDIARICHAHPTQSEAVMEAAWATFAKAIHA